MRAKAIVFVLLSALLIGLARIQDTPAPYKSETVVTAQPTESVKQPPSNSEQVTKPVAPEIKAVEATKPQEQQQSQEKPVAQDTPEAWMNALGIPEDDKPSVDYIMHQESSWCPTRWQGEHGPCPAFHGTPEDVDTGYGLCQSTPASKMASAGADWQTNPITQFKWCAEYVKGYGGWPQAAEFKRCTGWCYSTRIAGTVYKRTPYL